MWERLEHLASILLFLTTYIREGNLPYKQTETEQFWSLMGSSEIFTLTSPSVCSVNLQKVLILINLSGARILPNGLSYLSGNLILQKKLFRKLSLHNLCKRLLISVKERWSAAIVRLLLYCWTPKEYFWRKGQILSRSDVNLIIVIKSNWISC